MAVIKTENLTYVYGEGTPFRKTAVDNVNIEINDGEMVGIIGHTGSGKSTLIQHFNGLLKPTSGSVYIDGERLWDDKSRLRPIRFKVGLVFQYPEYQLFEETCYKDIAFGPKNMGIKEDQIDKYVKEAARMVGLSPEILDKSPFELSGGQKRRVGNIVALALVGGAYIAIGIFCSSFTENQIVAAVISFIALIFVSFLSTIGNLLPFEWLTTVCEKVSFGERYYSFTYGLFDFSNVVFFLSAIVAFLFLTVRVLEKRRWG